jgi:hypothetical protein
MKAPLLYRVAAVLLLLFAVGHTLGFQRVDPRWGIDGPIKLLQATSFPVQGVRRTYWGFYVGFGLFVTTLLLFAAAIAWQLGALPHQLLRAMPVATWGLGICFVVVTVLSWKYFFILPVAFSAVITACLLAAAWIGAIS